MLLGGTARNAERWTGPLLSHSGAAFTPLCGHQEHLAPVTPGGDRALGASLVFPQSPSTSCWHFMLGAAIESSLRTGIMSVLFSSVVPAPSIVTGTKLSK